MRTLTISLNEDAYQAIRDAVRNHPTINEHSVTNWLEKELNDNTEVIIEMLLTDH